MSTLLRDLNTVLQQGIQERPPHVMEAYHRLYAFIEANQPWLPPQQEGFGPWVEWQPGSLGPRVGETILRLFDDERQNRLWFQQPRLVENCTFDRVVAYCVKESGE